jgi:hypothetical protein
VGTHFACPDPNSLSGSGSVDLIESRFQIQSRSGYKTLAAEYIEHYSSVPNCIRRVHYLLVFPDPESQFLSQISNPGVKKGTNNTELKKNFSILNQKLLPSSQKYERRCSSRIQIFPSRKQAKKALDPASRILDQDSHDCFIFMTFFY